MSEEKGYKGSEVVLQHKNYKLIQIKNLSLFVIIAEIIVGVLLYFAYTKFIIKTKYLKFLILPKNIINIILIAAIVILSVSVLFFVLMLKKTKKVKFDDWLLGLAHRKIGCCNCYYDAKNLYLEYDIAMNPKELKEFVVSLSDKSTRFTYYFLGQDVNQGVIMLGVSKQAKIPEKCTLDIKNDTQWNFIPLGEVIDHKLQKVVPIGWYINKEGGIKEDAMDTEASTSMLIAGGTGSGKSVQENCIIGHCTRFPDHFQLFLSDPKKVEFGPMRDLQSVKLISTETETIAKCVKQMRDAMNKRYSFMKSRAESNVYSLIGEPVDHFSINGRKPEQFDEFIMTRIDGEEKLMTMEEIFEEYHFQKRPNYKEIREKQKEEESKQNRRRGGW